MSVELYHKYRPKTLKEVIGQKAALAPLVTMGKQRKIPHAILFTGPSGVGKTTTARILATLLKCSKYDLFETNTAQVRGIDAVREITRKIGFAPVGGKARVWILDEIHQASTDASEALLKVLEDTPSHVYFFLCTTDPQKLKQTIRTRCHLVELKSLSDKDIGDLIRDVAEKEGVEIPSEVVIKIQDCSDGSARQALVFLHAVLDMKDEKAQLEAITKGSVETFGIDIARLLIKRGDWKSVTRLLKQLKSEDPEKVRWVVMGYASAVLLNKSDPHVAHVLECFRDNFYDSKFNGLVMACWEVLHGDG